MRILIVASLLASVALPSAAFADGPRGHRGESSSSAASNSSDSGPRRGGSASRDESPRNVQRSEAPPAPRPERPFAGRRDQAPQAPQAQPSGQARQDRPFPGRRNEAPQTSQAQPGDEARQAWQRNRRDTAPAIVTPQGGVRERIERQREARRGGGGAVAPTAIPTNRSPVRSRTFANGRDLAHAVWQHHDWRNDRRYDWRDYRRSNWSLFHFGFYNDPFGYGYNRFQVGWSLWPSYYGSNYWINDPWEYRLPPAYGPYRWVRYYDDALLVDTYTGEVVDVVYDFFW